MKALERFLPSAMLGAVPRPFVLVVLLILGTLFPDVPWKESVALLALAFVQNAAYSLQSRAANRTSNLYHFIAAVFAVTIFFVTLSFLVHIKVTLNVLLVYILGTMLGSVYGTRLSVVLEKALGAVSNLGAEVKGQVLPLSKATFGLVLLFALELVFFTPSKAGQALLLMAVFAFGLLAFSLWGAKSERGVLVSMASATSILVTLGISVWRYEPQLSIFANQSLVAVGLIALAAFVSNLLFASLRVARNTDAYWFHLALVLVHAVAGFVTYKVLVQVNGDWYLFAPYLTGSVLGSLIGAEVGKRFGKFIKASWNAHDLPKDVVPLPVLPMLVCLLLLIPHFFYVGFVGLGAQVLILGAALLQTSAFTVISRARQRNHELYIEWSSVFSNGIWFVTLNILVVNELAPYLLVPYLVGTGIGSLWGQAFAMTVEKQIGAFVDKGAEKPKP